MLTLRTLTKTCRFLVKSGAFAAVAVSWTANQVRADEPVDGDVNRVTEKRVKKTSVRAEDKSTHVQSNEIPIHGERSGHQLQTLCVDATGNILAVVAAGRPYGNKLEGKDNASEIRKYNSDGRLIQGWSVDFAVQAIAVAPKGTIFVSGNGKIAKYDSEGKVLAIVDLPHVAKYLNDSESIREQAEAQLEEQKNQFKDQVKELQEQVAEKKKKFAELKEALDAKDKDSVTASEKRKVRTAEMAVRALESQIKAVERATGHQELPTLDAIIDGMVSRLKISNALAASDKDVFVASGVPKGYGYAIWRFTHEFEEPKEIVSGLSGCCGQMDIHCCGDDVYAAENSRKSVLRFSREGKKLASFGSGGRDGGSGAEFGGCCNPMNLCFTASGDVLTAESEGYIKEFSKDGKFKGIIGHAKISGGCKNVALAVSPDGKQAYFCDLPGSRIIILQRKEQADRDESKPNQDDQGDRVSKR